MTESPETDTDTATQVLAALADPSRRALYEVLRRSDHPLGRDELAEQTGLPRPTAAFHLDRLVEVGGLTVEFGRRSGRTGPGAGRPAKFYALANDEITASVPARRYELAGDLLAAAAEYSDSRSVPMRQALVETAEQRGHELGSGDVPLVETLAGIGYAPVACDDGGYRLMNCPFHRLAARHTDLICTANTAFVRGLTQESDEPRDVWLEPTAGECCVRIGEVRR
jgi:predicted ArsR family transcriptional regulator